MAWRLSGTYFETCNCDVACPCTVSSLQLPATYERCNAMLAFHVEDGEIEGIDVRDMNVVVVGDTPRQMSDGGWRLALFVDERATAEQLDKLAAAFSGRLGGPMELLAPLIGELLGMEQAPITYVDDARLHRVTVGDAIDVQVEDLQAEHLDEPTRIVNVEHPANTTLALAQARGARVDAFGISFEGRTGASAPFAWAA
jgi:hypothetical protein